MARLGPNSEEGGLKARRRLKSAPHGFLVPRQVARYHQDADNEMISRVIAGVLLLAAACAAQPKRVLYITHSAGFVHGSIPASVQALRDVTTRAGDIEIVATED